MKITREDIEHIADLARLEMDEASIEKFADQIATILSYIDMLNSVATDGVPTTAHAVSISNAFREDVPTGHLDRKDALGNAPDSDDECFLVPKIIG